MKKIALLILVTFIMSYLPGVAMSPVGSTLAAGLADPVPVIIDDFEIRAAGWR